MIACKITNQLGGVVDVLDYQSVPQDELREVQSRSNEWSYMSRSLLEPVDMEQTTPASLHAHEKHGTTKMEQTTPTPPPAHEKDDAVVSMIPRHDPTAVRSVHGFKV
jgi:hypothetical protein